jgi:hypothetical protein
MVLSNVLALSLTEGSQIVEMHVSDVLLMYGQESENECRTKNIVDAAEDNGTLFILLILFSFVRFFLCRRHMYSLENSYFFVIKNHKDIKYGLKIILKYVGFC